MVRKHVKQVKLSDKEKQLLEKGAAKQHQSECEYIRTLIRGDKSEFIRKSEVYTILMHMDMIFCKNELKDRRTVQMIKKEMGKLWKLL